MTVEETFLAYLGKSLNRPAEQLADLLFQTSDDGEKTLSENALDTLLAFDAERVQKLKPNTKEYFDNGYKKGQSEVMGSVEQKLRERFGIDPDKQLQGDALFDAISAAMEAGGAKPDKVKSSAEYLALEREMRRQLEELQGKHTAELENIRREAQREQTWGQVSAKIRDYVRKHQGLNQDAITDPMLELLAMQFRDYDYQLDGEDYLPLKDGSRVEDAHGHARRLADLVSERAESIFPRIAQSAAGNAGNRNGQGKPAVTARFENEAEYWKAYNAAPIADRPALYAAWEAQQAKG